MAYVAGARPVVNFNLFQDQSKQPETVSATSPYAFTSVLGRQIPIVIGTGKVDGNPVIGGSITSKVITGYQQFPNSRAGAVAAGGNGFDSALDSFPPGSKYTTGDAFSPTVDVPVYGTSQGAQLGYLLAYDPFGLGYVLVRLEVNDTVVYDAENGIGATTTFRFYGGQHTAIDPITSSTIGANAGAWQNFAMVYLDGFAATSTPTVKAVISNAAAGIGDTSDWVLDFVNGKYLHNGAAVALSGVIDKPSRVVAKRGLQILDADPAGAVEIIGALFTYVATMNWTVTIEWEELTTSGRTYLLGTDESTDEDEILIERTAVEDIQAYGWGTDFRGVDNVGTGDQYGPGIHKTAVTYTSTFIALSTDGCATAVDTTANTMNPMQVAFFGGRGSDASGNGTFIRKVTLSAPVASSLLPVLSKIGDGNPNPTIVWTGLIPSTFADISGWYEAYDPVDSVIYHLLTSQDIAGLTTVNLAVLDTETLVERYRVPLQNSDLYAVPDPTTHVLQRPLITAIRGTGHVLIRFATDSTVGVSRIYDALTGAIVAEYIEPDTSTTLYWVAGQAFGSKYIFIGWNRFFSGDQHIYFAVADIGAGSLTITESSVAFREPAVWGRRINGTASFFSCSTTVGEVYELTFDGTSWTSSLVYTDAGIVHGLRFDPQTGYLIVSSEVSGSFFLRYVNPDDGSIITSFSTSGKQLESNSFGGVGGFERFWSRPGYALWVQTNASSEAIYLLDIAAQTLTLWSGPIPHGNDWTGAVFDQTRGVYYAFYGDDHWTQYGMAGNAPGSITLQSLITRTMFLVGYSSGELTFDGFTGLTAYGFVIDQDTNVRTVLQSIADIYAFSFADTGNGFYFKKPGRDADFALDDTVTTADLVFGDTEAIKSEDAASISTVSRVELQYISKDQGYNSRPASFAMPAINNSITIQRYSTPLVLTDQDAQTFVTEKFFDLQAKRRTHSFSTTGKPTYLPGDVIAVPSGEIIYMVQIDSVGMDRNLTADITALDFQTRVSTTVTSVTVPNVIPVSQATQYVHLDIPLINYADDLNGVALCQYGILAGRGQANWSGGVLLMGATADALTQAFTQAPHQGVVGVCVDVLANPLDPFGTGDTSTVTIRRTAGSTSLLVNHTETEVLAGANLAFVGKAGRWEGIGYETVADNGDGTFTLSGLAVRGYRGSEVYCSLHEVGDIFVLIDPSWVGIMSLPLTDLNTTKYFEGVGVGQNPAGGVITPQVIRGFAEKPYASRNLNAEVVTDGIELTWDYRSRLASGLNPANFGEASLVFEIDILEPVTDGYSVVRTMTAATNSKLYANADIASDFGSTPAFLAFRVYMMSATTGVGRGYRAQAGIVLTPGSLTADNGIIRADTTHFTADAA